ncbi:hypothetical protein [Arsenophonus sp. PmNCSU2021_1]
MTKSDYEVKYPLDAVSIEKFSELLGKPETAVRRMIHEFRTNKKTLYF